ncbi:CaiB/BaiF CoA transferase family protein [Roseovarius autotrophicus]|uniref:CaiB/BaiF CoA transferase family protein n=1 Tax=Roseovarius autotrophicus TaxID=2824121 RepID=UPI001B38C8A2|nr:CoA transferase [Roseovarius autotrophicus]
MTAPLDGVTVLDLTHVLAGPFASLTLRDLGARIIKVERPGTGDDTRAFPPFKDGQSAYFAAINHGKQSIALDLKAEGDRAIFDALLARADIVLENYRPGVMEKLGYGWEALHASHPRLIYGAVSGFGHTGPDAERPAYDMVVQARGGVMSITGEKDREPVRVGASIGDIVAGMYLVQGVLAALIDRKKTGQGRKVDVAMLDSQLAILEHAIAITTATGKPPSPSGARHPSITPFETFHAADGLFVIAAGNDALFVRLCDLLGLPIARDPRFATNAARCENARTLKRLIEAITLDRPKSYWIERLEAAGVPTGPIQNLAEVLHDRQILARNMVVDVLGPDGQPAFVAAGNPIKMSGMDDPASRPPAPVLDGDREAIIDWLQKGVNDA